MRGRYATERAVYAMGIVIVLVFAQLARQVDGIPEEHTVKILSPDRPDQPFNKRMRDRSEWNRLELLDLHHAQVSEPAVKAEKRIVIGTEVFRFTLPGGGSIEHSARRNAIDACGADAKADDTTGEDVHDEQDPMAAQDHRFNAKQIDTPDAIFCLSDDGQPGRTIGNRLGSKVYGEHASHDIFVDLDAKGVSDLLGDADTTELRIAVLHLDDGRDELLGRALRARLSSPA